MNILFIVTGSIAVSRCFEILNELKKNKIRVNCIITNNAKKLLDTNKLKKSLSGNIYTDASEKKEKMLHINLSRKNDLIVVCPATANTIAKLANGLADDALGCIVLAAEPGAKLVIAPALNGKMWGNPATQANVRLLSQRGAQFIGPEQGELSCGYEGLGRLSSVETITREVLELTGLGSSEE